LGDGAGARFVKERTPEAILRHELELCRRFCNGARHIDGVKLYADITVGNLSLYAPVVSFNVRDKHSSEVSQILGERGFCLRGGLHCAPMAHKKLGTLESGTVRFSPSVFTTAAEVEALLRELRRMADSGTKTALF